MYLNVYMCVICVHVCLYVYVCVYMCVCTYMCACSIILLTRCYGLNVCFFHVKSMLCLYVRVHVHEGVREEVRSWKVNPFLIKKRKILTIIENCELTIIANIS